MTDLAGRETFRNAWITDIGITPDNMKGLEIGPYALPEGSKSTRQNRPKTKI